MLNETTLKVVSIFVILFGGALGVYLPTLFRNKVPESDDEIHVIFLLCKLFSAGIILGTGFVHMLPEAQSSIEKALPDVKYPISGVISGISIIFLMTIEQLINKFFHNSKKKKHSSLSDNNITQTIVETGMTTQFDKFDHSKSRESGSSTNKSDSDRSESDNSDEHYYQKQHSKNEGHCHTINIIYQNDPLMKKLTTVFILEVGIAIHSIIIGITLGTTVNKTSFVSLFIAMSLHQFFEGIALGSSIVKAKILEFWKVMSMVGLFSFSTPIGIIIGILTNNSYNPESKTSYLTQGIFNAISAGVLIYMALIHLIIEDFNNNDINGNIKFLMLIAILLGFGTTSVIAIWT
jgi:zinc transporter 1/2/3